MKRKKSAVKKKAAAVVKKKVATPVNKRGVVHYARGSTVTVGCGLDKYRDSYILGGIKRRTPLKTTNKISRVTCKRCLLSPYFRRHKSKYYAKQMPAIKKITWFDW